MTASDLPAFLDSYRGLAKIFALPRVDVGDPALREQAYFKALRSYEIRQVKAGADKLTATRQLAKFPIPAEWIAAMPANTRVAPDMRQMTVTEAREYAQAEQCGYERPGARFVPVFDADDREVRVFDPIRQRVVTEGRWITGAEYSRWVQAKDSFYAKFRALVGAKRMREPGQEG